MGSMNEISTRLESAEREVERLTGVLAGLQDAAVETVLDPELEKLKYRLQILKRGIEAEEKKMTCNLKSTLDMLISYCRMAVDSAFPGIGPITIPVVPASSRKFGDYQCNVAMSIASKVKKNPKQVADLIVANFPSDTKVVGKVDVAGAGFINIHICPKFLLEEVKKICVNGVHFAPLLAPQRVLVDFSSPNLAKEMHVGHLRSTIIGDSICRLLEELGHDVLRINHVGDWGTQFGMLIAHLQDTFQDYLKEGYELPISDLQAFYKESKARFDEDPEFKKRAYACVVSLQKKEPNIMRAWQVICDVSRREFSKIYDRLGVTISEIGESFYQPLMESLVEEFKSKGFLEEDGGRWIMWAESQEKDVNPPLTVIKSDGGFTYDTSDLAALRHRIDVQKANRIIYVTDAGQFTHFQTIWDCGARAGILNKSKVRVDHAGFGVVLGDDKKKFKTRSGDTIKLADLLDEGIKRASEKLREKGRQVDLSADELEAIEKSVAYGCIKYADLSHNRNAEYVFSFDRMLDDKGNTAVYLLYAYTRIKSIARKAGVTDADYQSFLSQDSFTLEHEKELKLALQLLKVSEVVDRVSDDLYLHPICEFMYETATAFSEFYDACYVIETNNESNEKKVNMSRVALCEATAAILKKGFDILGITPVSKM